MDKSPFDISLEDLFDNEIVSLQELGVNSRDINLIGTNAEVALLKLIVDLHQRI